MKKLLLLLTLCVNAFCFCMEAVSQNVEVILTIDTFSPFIAKYTKEQMTKKLIDTVISTYHSRFLELGRDLNFYTKADARPKSKLPGYKLELLVTDSVGDTKKVKGAHWVILHSKLFEEEIPTDKVEWQHGSGSTYTTLGGKREDDAISVSIVLIKIIAGISLDLTLPLSLTERIPARNVFEKKDVDGLESLREIVVIIDNQSIKTFRKEDVDKLMILINNVFFSSQNSFAKRKGADKSYFNYYLTTDPAGYSGKTVYDHPIELKFVVKSVGNGNCQIKMEFDEKKYLFGDYFGQDIEGKTILVTADMLQRMPSKINHGISELVDIFIRSNLD